jgi:MscS family membrane protein
VNMEEIVSIIPVKDTEILGFNLATLVALGGLFVLLLITRQIVKVIMPRFLARVIAENKFAGKVVADSTKPLGTAAGCGVVFLLLGDMSGPSVLVPELISNWLPSILKLVMVVTIVMWAYKLVGIVQAVFGWLDDDEELDGSEKTLITAIESVLRFCITIFGAVFIADALGFDLNTMIAGLGITGLALALAAKDTISNLFGATVVLLDRPFKIGDWVIIGDVEGEVTDIGLRTTLIRTSLDTVITMPNANLTNTPVENWGKRRFRRWQPIIKLDINSDPSDVDNFCNGVMELIKANGETMKEESSWAQVSALGPDAIDIGCNIYWDIASSKVEREARNKFLLSAMNLAKEHGLSFHDGRIRHSA